MSSHKVAYKVVVAPSSSFFGLEHEGEMTLYFDSSPDKESVLEAIEDEIVATYGGPPLPTWKSDRDAKAEDKEEEESKKFDDACRMIVKDNLPDVSMYSTSGFPEMLVKREEGEVLIERIRVYAGKKTSVPGWVAPLASCPKCAGTGELPDGNGCGCES